MTAILEEIARTVIGLAGRLRVAGAEVARTGLLPVLPVVYLPRRGARLACSEAGIGSTALKFR